MSFKRALDEVRLRGEVVSLPMRNAKSGVKLRLNQLISVVKRRYFVVGGVTGSGKSAFVDSLFVLSPIEYALRTHQKPPTIIYRVMERSKEERVLKWMCWKIYVDKGIVLDVPTLLGHPNKLRDLTQADLDLINSYEPYLLELEKHITLIGGTATPEEVKQSSLKIAHKKGRFFESRPGSMDHFVNGEKAGTFSLDQFENVNGVKKLYVNTDCGRLYFGDSFYVPNDKQEQVIHILDNLQNLSHDDGQSDKKKLDTHAANMAGIFRDKFQWTIIDVNQFNSEIDSTYRQLKTELVVKQSDFKDSRNQIQLADVVLGLINPAKYDLKKYKGYRINEMEAGFEHRFRGLWCVKNSYGVDDFFLGCYFLGACGYIGELPKDITEDDYQDVVNAKFY